MQEKTDESWNIGEIVHTLTNRFLQYKTTY
jgi:hypothetical protein